MANTPSTGTNTDTTEAVTYDPRSNVLPKTATRDEVDVHWMFNFAEGDIAPPAPTSIYEQALLGRRVQASSHNVTPPDPAESQLKAARRSSQILRVLARLSARDVSALARWAASPARAPEAVRTMFGRLAFVTALTEAFDEIGGTKAFVGACVRASGKRDKEDGTLNFLRHAARVKLAIAREQAEEISRDAFAAYARERAAVHADDARSDARKADARAPALAEIMAIAAAAPATSTSAIAELMSRKA